MCDRSTGSILIRRCTQNFSAWIRACRQRVYSPIRFHEDSFGTLAIQFDKQDGLPGAEIEARFSEGDDRLMIQKHALEVDAGVAFEAALMFVIIADGADFAEPCIEVFEEAGLFVVDDYCGIGVQRGNEDDAVAKSALFHRGFQLRGNVENFPFLGGLQGDVFVNFHRPLLESGGM